MWQFILFLVLASPLIFIVVAAIVIVWAEIIRFMYKGISKFIEVFYGKGGDGNE